LVDAEIQTQLFQGDPSVFSPEELLLLQRRFGVHGPQTQLAQLFTRGMDQFQPSANSNGQSTSSTQTCD
jgi:hypothetical protein